MDEQDWLTCTDSTPMLHFLQGKISDRKLRLFAVSCYRLIWHWITDAPSRRAVDVADRFADRLASRRELADAHATAYTTYLNSYDNSLFAYAVADEDAAHAATIAARDVAVVQRVNELATLVRDVIANPFRPLPLLDKGVLAWSGGIIPRLAQAIYDDRHLPTGTLDAERLAVLADALEDAGLTEAELLGHLRKPGPHFRGCWPVDLLLGRS
ncbi:MAG: hypothetical protein HYS12_13350 [Planctomycetes bacterium]|nr:hypothetical protein [Planctomycetota bacterium]